MIKSKKQHFCCVESKKLAFGEVEAKKYYDAIRDSETEYIISGEGIDEFRATRQELLDCGYLC